MDIKENIKEGIKSIKASKLRTFLTAAIIAIGITSLVGILTAIDGIQASIDSSFSSLGANTFDIESKRQSRGSNDGKKAKIYPPIKYAEFVQFKEEYDGPGTISINTVVSWNTEVKYRSKVTNPNIRIRGGDENFLIVDGYDIGEGRSFSQAEMKNGAYVCIIGSDLVDALFENVSPVGKKITLLGSKFKVIGTVQEQGAVSGNTGVDKQVVVPLNTARILGADQWFGYEATVSIPDTRQIEQATGIATGLMRSIRRDPITQQENSFEVKVNRSLAERIGEITSYLQAGGFTIGFVTLIGASIGLMNIMLVSVTERTREIGVRKALGATPLKIRQQFLIEAIVICQMGGIGGIILGIIIGNVTSSFIGSGGFIIPWVWIIFGVAVGMIVGLISGVIPAYKASKLDPIESLRFE